MGNEPRATPLSFCPDCDPKSKREDKVAIRVVPDLGAPLAVTAVDLMTETWAPTWNEWTAYIAAVGGYLGGFMGWGGDFTKNVGIASFPWAAKKLYDRVRGGAVTRTSNRMSFRKGSVARYPAPAYETQFAGVKLV